jgi:hypothetical protein
MKRRKFVALVSSAEAWPVVARAQQAMPVIGFLSTGGPPSPDSLAALREALPKRTCPAPWTGGLNCYDAVSRGWV